MFSFFVGHYLPVAVTALGLVLGRQGRDDIL